MKNLTFIVSALAVLAFTSPAFASPKGFGSETDTSTNNTQGMSGKPAKNHDNEGTSTTVTTTTTTGPKGALKNDKDTPNQETSTDSEVTNYPGKNR